MFLLMILGKLGLNEVGIVRIQTFIRRGDLPGMKQQFKIAALFFRDLFEIRQKCAHTFEVHMARQQYTKKDGRVHSALLEPPPVWAGKHL